MKPVGEPAPRNFDKERPGPGWQISDATLHEIEMLERHMRCCSAPTSLAPICITG